jgi:hypothetical protein
MNPKRKRIQDLILKVMKILDESMYNYNIYEEFFRNMSDEEFSSWLKTLKGSRDCKVTLLVPPMKVNISTTACFKVAKLLGVEFMERLRLWDPIGKRYCLTPEKYFIFKLPVRRLKQYLMDGLSVPDDDKKLNPLTDQVVGPSKGSAISFPQAQMISEKGLTTTLHELMSIRGGDLEAYSRLKAEIEETGTSDTGVMKGTRGTKAAQSLRSFFTAMHLSSNV